MTRRGTVSVLAGRCCSRVQRPARRTARAAGTQRRSRSTVTAKAAILIDNQTGEILWQRNPDLPLPPASTTKIVTAMLALQSGRLDDSLSVTPEAAQAPPSKISLRAGWRMRLRDLVYAILLNSANDAAVVIAEGLSGSVRDFADRMNAQARLLGATNTHFVNPNGLPADEPLLDGARPGDDVLARACSNPLFEQHRQHQDDHGVADLGLAALDQAAQRTTACSATTTSTWSARPAGRSPQRSASSAPPTADGRELIVAVMGSRDLWGDLKRLLEFGFSGTMRRRSPRRRRSCDAGRRPAPSVGGRR